MAERSLAREEGRPDPAAQPTESGLYNLTLRVADNTRADRWANASTVVSNNITLDMTKHCRWFSRNGRAARFDDDDFVVISVTKV